MVCDWYEVHGRRFGLRSTSEAFAAWLRYALAAYRTEPTEEERDAPFRYSIVVDDGIHGEEQIGRRYNILYLGTRDIARTLDLRFLARCLLHQIDSIGYHERDDAIFLDAGLVSVGGSVAVIPALLVPPLCKARRRAEKRNLHAPGGVTAALDPDSGELVAPRLSLDLPADALERLQGHPGVMNGVRDRSPVEDGERRTVGAVIGLDTRQQAPIAPKPRSTALLDLALTVKNRTTLGARVLRPIAAMVTEADSLAVNWSNPREMIDVIAEAADRP